MELELEFEAIAEVYKALSDKTRLRMVALLRAEQLCVCELVEILQMSQPMVSQHLRKLKNVKLVKERRVGMWVLHSLDLSRYPFLEASINQLPDLSYEIEKLTQNGLRVICSTTG